MALHPQVHYASAGDVRIAYRVLGDGPFDVVFVPGMLAHVDWWWETPRSARFFERLAAFARVIVFDKRGVGASDRGSDWAPLEERMDDLLAVLRATASRRPAVVGVSEGGPMSLLFAATHPRVCRALCVVGGFARLVRSDDYPHGFPAHLIEATYARFADNWGQPGMIEVLGPTVAGDPREREAWARFERMGSNPGAVRAVGRMVKEIDLRPVLPQIRVPTLIVHAAGDLGVPVGAARYLADNISGAKYVEYPTRDHAFWLHPDPIADAVKEFLTGTPVEAEPDRMLTTVLFVDIAGSTERAATLGDAAWASLLGRFLALARERLAQFRGREIDHAGDGFLASFDGPARAVRCAEAIRDGVRALGLEVRAGVHTGECQRLADKLAGIAVHIGARIAQRASPGEVVVSGTVRDLVSGSGLRFVDRGEHSLRGVPGTWRLLALAGGA